MIDEEIRREGEAEEMEFKDRREVRPIMTKPKIVTLCGSTRFFDAFQKANYDETMAGRIVLSVGFYPHSHDQAHGEGVGHDSAEKMKLDTLHLRKIDLADEILVLNVDTIVCKACHKPAKLFTEASRETDCCRVKQWVREPYIGESTRREIVYARGLGKPVRWLNEPEGD